jgi:hypothetical protein
MLDSREWEGMYPLFEEVKYYLGSGAVREYFDELLCRMDEILNEAYDKDQNRCQRVPCFAITVESSAEVLQINAKRPICLESIYEPENKLRNEQ